MGVGAQPSESVLQLFKSVGLVDRFERFKKGETQEVLLAEAAKVYETHTGKKA
jgi:small subunit ribosomal protein S16